MERVIVVGTSGAGKRTLARQLAARYYLSHVELDRLFWKPDWQPRDYAEFCRLVQPALSGPRWIADGNS